MSVECGVHDHRGKSWSVESSWLANWSTSWTLFFPLAAHRLMLTLAGLVYQASGRGFSMPNFTHNVLNLVQSGSLSFQWEKLHHPEEATNPCVLVLVLPETGPETRIWGQIVYLYSYLRKEQWRSREVRQERESSLWRFIYIQQVTTMATWGSDRLGFSGTQNGTHSRVALARKLG